MKRQLLVMRSFQRDGADMDGFPQEFVRDKHVVVRPPGAKAARLKYDAR